MLSSYLGLAVACPTYFSKIKPIEGRERMSTKEAEQAKSDAIKSDAESAPDSTAKING